ncbi:MAG: hypothetical protein AAF982_06125 [Pseudomonadota bacterium]
MAALAGLMTAGAPASVWAQDLFNPFDVGGGLLSAPPPGTTLRAGVPGTSVAADGETAAGARGGDGAGRRDEGRGPVFTLDLSTGIRYEEEEDEPTEAFWRTRADLEAFAETRNQRFTFGFGAELRAEEGMTDISRPTAGLNYQLFNRSTAFEADLTWREVDVDSGFLPEDFDADDIDRGEGTRETHAARFTLETGLDARFGTRTVLAYRQTDFTDTVDPDLVNEIRYDASTELRFSIDRRIQVTAFAEWSEESEDDAMETVETNTRFGVGADLLIDRVWSANIDLAFAEEEIETTGGTVVTEGAVIDLRLVRDMRNGSLSFSANHNGTEDISSFTAARRLALANGASVSAELGLISFEDGDVLPTVGLTYRNEILRGRTVTLSLRQSGTENDDDEAIFRTVLNAAYRQELTRNSQFGVNGAIVAVTPQEGGDPDTLAASLGVSYSHDLTRDWALVARADARQTFEDGTRTDRSGVFSVNLERTFSFRP